MVNFKKEIDACQFTAKPEKVDRQKILGKKE